MTEALDRRSVFLPECCLFFNHTVFRGNRVSKVSSADFNAFTSTNFSPLVNGEYLPQPLSAAFFSEQELILLDSGNRHRGELERSHPTNEPSQIQSA